MDSFHEDVSTAVHQVLSARADGEYAVSALRKRLSNGELEIVISPIGEDDSALEVEYRALGDASLSSVQSKIDGVSAVVIDASGSDLAPQRVWTEDKIRIEYPIPPEIRESWVSFTE